MQSLCKSDSKTLERAWAKKAFFFFFQARSGSVRTGADLLRAICPTVRLFVRNQMANLDYLDAN